MSENIKVLRTAKQGADRVPSFAYESNLVFKNQIGLPFKAFTPDEVKKIEASMVKNKKDADFCGSFDGDWVKYFVRIGSEKIYKECEPKNAARMSDPSINTVDARDEKMQKVVNFGIATQSQFNDLKKKPIKI